jgi:hypothetical protein
VVELSVAAACVVLAAGVGLAIHVADVRRHAVDDDRSTVEGLDIADLFRPLLTLVALLLAFVLVQTFASFPDASDSASEEATAVLSEAPSARRLTPASAGSIIGALRCSALAVAGPGWDALAATRVTSPVTEVANDRVEETLLAASEVAADQPALDSVLEADAAGSPPVVFAGSLVAISTWIASSRGSPASSPSSSVKSSSAWPRRPTVCPRRATTEATRRRAEPIVAPPMWSPHRPGFVEHDVVVDDAETRRARRGRHAEAEGARAELTDPLAVLVLVVDDRDQQRRSDHTELLRRSDRAFVDLFHPSVDPRSHRVAMRADALQRRELPAVSFRSRGVHQGVDAGIDARFGGDEVAEQVVGDGGLVAEVPADRG